jgi:guanine deaminase
MVTEIKWLVIKNATYAHSVSRKEIQIVKNATITISLETGKIESIKIQQNLKTLLPQVDRPNTKVIQMKANQLLIPGLIDCHAHAPQF